MSDPYTQPDLPDIYAAMATYANAIDGLTGIYPAPATLPNPPALIVFGGGGTVVHGSTQMISLRPKAHLMVATKGATIHEITRADRFLFPIIDAFSADTDETDGFTLGGIIDRCVVADWEELAVIGYAGHRYIGYPIFFDLKVHRHAVGAGT